MPRKVILFLLILLGSSPTLLADHVHWMGNYDKALQKAIALQKPLLVLVVKPRHKPSVDIVQSIFMNQPWVETINRRCVSVMVTYAPPVHYPVEMYDTKIFPTLFLVNPEQELPLHDPLHGDAIDQIDAILPGVLSATSPQITQP